MTPTFFRAGFDPKFCGQVLSSCVGGEVFRFRMWWGCDFSSQIFVSSAVYFEFGGDLSLKLPSEVLFFCVLSFLGPYFALIGLEVLFLALKCLNSL